MKRLLIACDTDYNTLRALNLLGSKHPVSCLNNKNQSPPPFCTNIIRDFKTLLDDSALNVIHELKELQFDEIYLSASSITEAQQYKPLINKLETPSFYFIVCDRILKDLNALKNHNKWTIKLSDLQHEIISTTGDNKRHTITQNDLSTSSQPIPLYALLGTYCEEDIIYSTAKHAQLQGCEKIFLIDNQSTDNTIEQAQKGGATLHTSFKSEFYNEMERIYRMNEITQSISEESKHDEIWWMWLDADEFLESPANSTLYEYLNTLPNIIRTVGCHLINYFPTKNPAYIQGTHPRTLMTEGERFNPKSIRPHCENWHWKHSVFKWKRNDTPIRARTGFHVLSSTLQIVEANESLTLHHFPFREKTSTFKRYTQLCETTRNSNNDSVSIANQSTITKRYKNLEHIYNQNWENVYIYSGELKEEKQIGVTPVTIPYSGPIW